MLFMTIISHRFDRFITRTSHSIVFFLHFDNCFWMIYILFRRQLVRNDELISISFWCFVCVWIFNWVAGCWIWDLTFLWTTGQPTIQSNFRFYMFLHWNANQDWNDSSVEGRKCYYVFCLLELQRFLEQKVRTKLLSPFVFLLGKLLHLLFFEVQSQCYLYEVQMKMFNSKIQTKCKFPNSNTLFH